MEGTIADVRCPRCGAPARYDIRRQQYLCAYCGAAVGVRDALAQKQGFRSIQQAHIRASAQSRRLMRAGCTGCGAELVFDEGEAMTTCAFCGRALVRKEYLADAELPELIIPFRITRDEAAACLEDWCRRNPRRPEAKHLRAGMAALQGVYLPYELVRGAVSADVSRMDSTRVYRCVGYVDRVFINASAKLNNLLLDGMEPYELDEIRPFDFSFAAGQRIKIAGIDAAELQKRVGEEVSADYAPVVRKTMETQAVEVRADTGGVLRMPVLLPVYYIAAGDAMAAVNGQTGKVSVLAEKESHYYFLPWWLKAILSTLAASAAALGAFSLFGMELRQALMVTGMLALVLFVVTMAAFSDTVRNKFREKSGRRIFTSGGGPLRRVNGTLTRDAKPIQKEVTPPLFVERLDGRPLYVKLVFSSPLRKARMILLALVAMFLPVILALLINGFDFQKLTLGGSAVWFCIALPTVPIYLLKFGVIELYNNPWIYCYDQNWKPRRYRKKRFSRADVLDALKYIGIALVVPPLSLGVWFGIACFCVMVYLTAFGF